MSNIYTVEQTASIMKAMQSVMHSNNGYATVGNDPAVIEALELAGFTVILSRDLWGNRTHKAFTPAGKAAQIAEQALMPRPVVQLHQDYDYEGAILARQERMGFYD